MFRKVPIIYGPDPVNAVSAGWAEVGERNRIVSIKLHPQCGFINRDFLKLYSFDYKELPEPHVVMTPIEARQLTQPLITSEKLKLALFESEFDCVVNQYLEPLFFGTREEIVAILKNAVHYLKTHKAVAGEPRKIMTLSDYLKEFGKD